MEHSVTSTSYAATAASMFTGSLSEGASGVFEIKESSDTLVSRMLDYIYTGDVQSSSSELAKPGPDPKVMLHVKMMEMGDIYLVDGLGLLAKDRFNISSCKLIRTTLIDFMRRRLMQRPLPAEVEESWEDATKNVPEFTRDLLKSFKDMPVLGHCHYCGITKTVPVAPL
ncbi:hypothetical protein E4U26_004667 [Claviceps purpurea]|nr:hypothetical protein E4U26_004667 [Claviceps purpurea]